MIFSPRTDRRRWFRVSLRTQLQCGGAQLFLLPLNQRVQRRDFAPFIGALSGDELLQQEEIVFLAEQFAELFQIV